MFWKKDSLLVWMGPSLDVRREEILSILLKWIDGGLILNFVLHKILELHHRPSTQTSSSPSTINLRPSSFPFSPDPSNPFPFPPLSHLATSLSSSPSNPITTFVISTSQHTTHFIKISTPINISTPPSPKTQPTIQ